MAHKRNSTTYKHKLQRAINGTHIDIFIFVTAIGLSPGGSSTVHIYTQTIHRTT